MRIGFREIIFFMILLAVPAVSLFYVFKPRNEEIKELREEILAKQQTLREVDEISRKYENLEEVIAEGQRAILKIVEKLPSERGVADILEQVWVIARNHKLTQKGLKSLEPVREGQYMEQPLEITMAGDFDGFYQFMLELENLPRITRIHKLKLERARTSGVTDVPEGWMTAEFTLSIYYEPDGRDLSLEHDLDHERPEDVVLSQQATRVAPHAL